MGAGLYPAGSGPAGADPTQPGGSVSINTPSAMRYEGASRDWAKDASGQYRRVHWVEQAFVLGCLIRKGAIKSRPEVGNSLFEIKYLGGISLAAEVNDRIRTAVPIASLLAEGAASIDRIEHSHNPQGQLRVAVYFRNLVVDRNKVIRADATV